MFVLCRRYSVEWIKFGCAKTVNGKRSIKLNTVLLIGEVKELRFKCIVYKSILIFATVLNEVFCRY